MRTSNKLARTMIWALFIIAFVLPYMSFSQWWKFVPATVAMLFCQILLHPMDWHRQLGLAMPLGTLCRAAALLVGVAVMAHFCVHRIAAQSGFAIHGAAWGPYRLLPLCQVLNEEMMFRALLLGTCVKLGIRPAYVSWLCAAIFAFAHVAIYRWGIAQTWLLPQTVVVLLCFALVTNAMYLSTGNIAYPIAVHLGWNFTRFGACWHLRGASWQTDEVFGLNTFEAHPGVVCLAIASCAIAGGAVDKLRYGLRAWSGPLHRET